VYVRPFWGACGARLGERVAVGAWSSLWLWQRCMIWSQGFSVIGGEPGREVPLEVQARIAYESRDI
ncbi:hypothetical protein, partial [Salmonella sp. SAL4445]|uniref:hypothetical protein n=1 Tax=Salmonella sp. SAL4445 TaxID=3159900 RepID=UPI00397CDEC9